MHHRSGKVFALDVLLEMLQEVETKAKENSCFNIESVDFGENFYGITAIKI